MKILEFLLWVTGLILIVVMGNMVWSIISAMWYTHLQKQEQQEN